MKIPKFRTETPWGSGLTNTLNKGTQQGFSKFGQQGRKSVRVENEANAIFSDQKITDLKLIIWTLKIAKFRTETPLGSGLTNTLNRGTQQGFKGGTSYT